MMQRNSDRGVAAIFVAVTLLFIVGAAAIAVDASGAFNTAQTDQNTADLACLAGVRELPDTTAAINQTVSYVTANWPEMSGQSLTITGKTATYTDGTGNTVEIDAEYNGDPAKMQVVIYEQSDTYFSKSLGANQVQVSQEAYCRGLSAGGGLGLLPVGVLPGGFAGNLFGPAPCSTGNCGGLDFGSGANSFEDALENGVDRALAKHHGNAANPDPDSGELPVHCDSVGSGDGCHMAKTKTGQMAGPLGAGLAARFSDTSGSSQTFTYKGNQYDADTPSQVLGASPTNMYTQFGSTAPSWWIPSLHGPWDSSYLAGHYWYDGVVAKCDSPRKAQVPIVVHDDDWDIGDGNPGWPSGTKTMKIIGFLDVIIKDPNDSGDFQGNSSLKSFSADIIWYGPNAVCSDGSPVGVINNVIGTGDTTVLLVDSTN